MTKSNKLFLGVITVLCILLWFKSCGGPTRPQEITVNVPEVTNQLPEKAPAYLAHTDTVYITKWRTKTDYIEIETPNPVNDSLALAYQKVADSLTRYKMFLEAIQIRDFTVDFSDEYIDLTLSGQVQGELRSIKPEYTIKERQIKAEIPIKTTALRVLAGGSIQTTTDLSTFTYSANLGLQNAKGNILRAGYANINGQDFIMAGYDFSILNIKSKRGKRR